MELRIYFLQLFGFGIENVVTSTTTMIINLPPMQQVKGGYNYVFLLLEVALVIGAHLTSLF